MELTSPCNVIRVVASTRGDGRGLLMLASALCRHSLGLLAHVSIWLGHPHPTSWNLEVAVHLVYLTWIIPTPLGRLAPSASSLMFKVSLPFFCSSACTCGCCAAEQAVER